MVRSLFSSTFFAVASICCFASGQTQSPTVNADTIESEMRSVLSELPQEEAPESFGLEQNAAEKLVILDTTDSPAVEALGIQPDSAMQVPVANETVITSDFGTAVSTPTTSQFYSFERDGIPTPQQRQQIRAMPIDQRPNRPFHFYGNAVRRRAGR